MADSEFVKELNEKYPDIFSREANTFILTKLRTNALKKQDLFTLIDRFNEDHDKFIDVYAKEINKLESKLKNKESKETENMETSESNNQENVTNELDNLKSELIKVKQQLEEKDKIINGNKDSIDQINQLNLKIKELNESSTKQLFKFNEYLNYIITIGKGLTELLKIDEPTLYQTQPDGLNRKFILIEQLLFKVYNKLKKVN